MTSNVCLKAGCLSILTFMGNMHEVDRYGYGRFWTIAVFDQGRSVATYKAFHKAPCCIHTYHEQDENSERLVAKML